MLVLLSILLILCFIMMFGSKSQEDRDNACIVNVVLLMAILFYGMFPVR